jgi:hypothetical protein
MFGNSTSPLIETALGLVFVWFLAATLCSGIVELVSSVFAFRASALWRTLGHALDDAPKIPEVALVSAAKMTTKVEPRTGSVLEAFVENVPGVTAQQTKRVKQIDTRVAAEALIATRHAHPDDFAATQLGKLVENLPSEVKSDAEKLEAWFGRWFDGTMSGLTATFRRSIRWWTVLVSVVIVVACGIESVGLAERLYDQPAQQAVLTAQADQALAAGEGSADCKAKTVQGRFECAKDSIDELSGLEISVWQVPDHDRLDWWFLVLGFGATVAAIAAGAPFWFDVMRRLSGLRKPAAASSSASP